MPDSFSENSANKLALLYSDSEREILTEINRCLLKGNQTAYLKAMQANCRKIVEDLNNGSRTWCEDVIPATYLRGVNGANDLLQKEKLVKIGVGGMHQQAAAVLAEATYSRLEDMASNIGRKVNDIYRNMALENIKGSTLGYASWKKVAQNYRNQLADKGITGFKDISGREWNMKTYSEMVARTSTMEAHVQGTVNRLVEAGHDLVEVSKHSNPCGKCKMFEGEILSLTGKTEGYKTLAEAKAEGLFHPNCRHGLDLSIDIDAEIAAGGKGEGKSPVTTDTTTDNPAATWDKISKNFVYSHGGNAVKSVFAEVPKDLRDKALGILQDKKPDFKKTEMRLSLMGSAQTENSTAALKAMNDLYDTPEKLLGIDVPIKVARINKMDVILDGNHRATLLRAHGRDIVEVEFVDLDAIIAAGKQNAAAKTLLEKRMERLTWEKLPGHRDVGEAFKWAEDNLGVQNGNYSDLPLDVVNSFNETVYNMQKRYPGIRTKYLGSCQTFYKLNNPKWTDVQVDKEVGRVYAFATDQNWGAYQGVSLNKKLYHGGMDYIKKLVENDISQGFHPKGTENPASIFTHELAHQLHYAILQDVYSRRGLELNTALKSAWRLFKKDAANSLRETQNRLSDYASKNEKEYFAEAMAEWIHSKTPRKHARLVGELVDKYCDLID